MQKEIKGVKKGINFICGAVAVIKEAVTDTKDSNKDVAEVISKRNGEFYLIGS